MAEFSFVGGVSL